MAIYFNGHAYDLVTSIIIISCGIVIVQTKQLREYIDNNCMITSLWIKLYNHHAIDITNISFNKKKVLQLNKLPLNDSCGM